MWKVVCTVPIWAISYHFSYLNDIFGHVSGGFPTPKSSIHHSLNHASGISWSPLKTSSCIRTLKRTASLHLKMDGLEYEDVSELRMDNVGFVGRVFSEIPRVQTMVSKTLSAPSVQIWDIQPKRCASEMSNNHSLYKRCKFSISETRTRHLRSLDDQQSNLSQYITN